MIIELFNAIGFAFLFTTVFAFRFEAWDNKFVVAAFFTAIAAAEWILTHLFVPHGAVGIELGLIGIALGMLFLIAIEVVKKINDPDARPDDGD